MKKPGKFLYTLLLIVTGTFFASILIFSKPSKPQEVPAFKERSGNLALSSEWINTKAAIEGLLATLKANPEDTKAMLQLVQAYIQESRVTGDHAYYDKAALELTDKILAKAPKNFDALCCKATVLLSQHHFSDALTVAQQAQQLNSYNSFIYGLLCDANVELGNYDEAVKMADKMISIRPDIRSYARVSYLREIYGDLPGAIQAMKLAVSAGYPGLEQTEWTRMMLGHLYEITGSPDSAQMQYQFALQERPDYAYAYAGLGRIEKEKGNYKQAIADFEKAKSLVPDFSFSDELTDLYLLNNEKEKSEKSAQEVIAMLSPQSNVEGVVGHGHYADKELAYAYLKTGNLDSAFMHAVIEYKRRPANIDVCETMAWVHYKRGEYGLAYVWISRAMRMGTKNPVLLCRAGLIDVKFGDTQKGAALIRQAFAADPFLDPSLKKEAQPYFAAN